MSVKSYATMVVVTISGTTFSPATLVVDPGDTIKWVAGTGSHSTISATIPSGAAPWNSLLDGSTPFFLYIPSVSGDYTYRCGTHGEEGAFTVTTPAKVGDVDRNLFSISPNPASGKIQIQFVETNNPATVTILDLTGRQLLSEKLATRAQAEIDISTIPNGKYIVGIIQNGKTTSSLLCITK